MRAFSRSCTLGLLLMLAGCGSGPAKEARVGDAWIRLPAVPGRPGAAYFTVTGGAEPARLVAIESPAATRIELHSMDMAGGHMTMNRIDGVDLKPGQAVSFAPEGRHAMLFGIPATLKAGSRVRMDFRFEKGGATSADARVVAAGDDAP